MTRNKKVKKSVGPNKNNSSEICCYVHGEISFGLRDPLTGRIISWEVFRGKRLKSAVKNRKVKGASK